MICSRREADGDGVPKVPGEVGIWIFVGGDLLVFTLMFAAYLLHAAAEPSMASIGRATLSQAAGLLNTALLLLSSWLVASAVRAARKGHDELVRRLLLGAIGCAAAFGIVKVAEWGSKLSIGITPTTNEFYSFYFALTGIHMIHVIVGSGVLALLTFAYRTNPQSHGLRLSYLESGATFWHMVDLLWIAILGLLYLLP